MSKVARSADGNERGNTIVLNRVKVMFQVFPGKKGTDDERGIKDVDYTVSVGKAKATGKTAADGGVEMDIPVGSRTKLEIFNTVYFINVERSIEAVTAKEGAKKRLEALGYEPVSDGAKMDEFVDRAALNFQADADINPEGTFGTTEDFNTPTEYKLKSEFGE